MHRQNHSDVLIVGGGIIGIACAYYLMKAGRQVRIIEQAQIGAGASHGNCGLVFLSHLIPLCAPGVILHELKRMFRRTSPLFIKPSLNPQFLSWLIQFARHCNRKHLARVVRARANILLSSERLFNRLFTGEELKCNWEKRGVLLVYQSAAAMEKYAKINQILEPYGLAAKPYIGQALRELEPALSDRVHGGWYHHNNSHLRPDALLQAWKKTLIRNGVDIVENCQLQGFVNENEQLTSAVTSCGNLTAEQFVLTTGAWSTQILSPLGIKLPLQAGKGYSITTDRPSICPQIPCIFEEKSVVATPWSDGYRLGGTMEFSGFNADMVGERLNGLKVGARQYLKNPLGKQIHEEWVGMRPLMADDLPVIDRAVGIKNLVVATGHGMMGISMAPATGKLVAELVTGKSPHIDPAPFTMKRFL